FSPEFSNSSLPFEKPLPQESITTPGVEIDKLKQAFKTQAVPLFPQKQETYYAYLKEHVLPYLVNTSSPRFIGHMTSALPSFNYELTDLVLRLNQNMVKVETSKSLVFLERQAMAMLHHAFYGFPDSFYDEYAQQSENSLGITVSGGTMANISALWVARNLALSKDDTFPGVAQAGLNAALEHYGYKNIVLLGSRLMHYSVIKAASLLGLGKDNILYVDQDENGKIDIVALQRRIEECRQKQWCILALIGIAGATETGNIDPLEEMADIASTFNIHFHVDAAWGGPVIFSEQHRRKLKGIERANSITLCGHKQLYLPMGISFCVFRQPNMVQAIATSAAYQAREGSYDFGQYSPEGSRASLSICLHAAFHLIGKQGYAELIDEGIDKAQYLKTRVEENDAFELIREPELNIVNFRYIPTAFRKKQRNGLLTEEDNLQINQANIQLQDMQFQEGRAFISRTQLSNTRYGKDLPIVVGRAVLANPLTTYQDIDFVLEDQLTIAANAIEIGSQKSRETPTNQPRITTHKGKRSSRRSGLAKELLEKYTVPIGKPLPNTQVYILDRHQKPVPIGVPGELYVGGSGLARGYFNRTELTKEKFINNPFSDNPNARLYKTGDLARYLSDGNIEYLGRIDNQVKIRGFRIELGEVESVLLQHSAVQEVIVVAREYPPGEKSLVAYIVPNQTISSRELRNELKKKLPGYMIPAAFVMLEAMPMTPNGKVDRRALPAPEHSLNQETLVASSNIQPTEKRLATIWSEVLGREGIGIHEIFFEIGGTSLLATRVIFKIRETFSIHLAVSDLFESPTIAGLAEVINEQNGSQRLDKLEMPEMPQDEDEALFKTLERMKLNELDVDEVAQWLFN
ncbi:MAG: aminotransferase class V-fold PLP-dependent enzyme, partial [Candidatus Parabeggiatoa sp.]|nr:aminotransferase class V-fold PLP-dependent enzyme [Candidatus Parabeggiatoa sp.]